MVALGAPNVVARRVIDDRVEFSGETTVSKYINFFIGQQIAEGRHFVHRKREEAQTARNVIAQLNAMIVEMEAMEDQGEVFDSLIYLREDRRSKNNKLMALNDLITQVEEEIKSKEAHVEIIVGGSNSGYLKYGNCKDVMLMEMKVMVLKINRVVVELHNVVIARAQFIEELDSWGPRRLCLRKHDRFLMELSPLALDWTRPWLNCRYAQGLELGLNAWATPSLQAPRHRRLIAELEALGQRGDALRALNYMREIVARDSAKLEVLEQLLACTHVGIPLKVGYVADMEEKE
ncbi:hypothetical protein Tco_0633126 [Tanacetum coccineum]